MYLFLKNYEVLDIENFRLAIPINDNDEEVFPLGLGISFNCKNQIDFENYGTQPASPLVLILTNEGLLVTFFAINFESKNRSLCQEAKLLKYVQPVPQQQQQQQNQPKVNQAVDLSQNINATPNQLNFNLGATQPTFGLNIPQNQGIPKFPQATANAPSLNFVSAPPTSNFPLTAQAQKPPLGVSIPTQAVPSQLIQNGNILQQQQKNNLNQLQQQQQQQQQIQTRGNLQQQQQNNIIPNKQTEPNCQTRVDDFKKELEELWVYSKVIKGKNLAKPLQLTKETAAIIEKFSQLNKEIKVVILIIDYHWH